MAKIDLQKFYELMTCFEEGIEKKVVRKVVKKNLTLFNVRR